MNKKSYKTLLFIFFPLFMYSYRIAIKIYVMFLVFGEVITMKCVAIIYASNEFKVIIKNVSQAIREEVMYKSNYLFFDNIIEI